MSKKKSIPIILCAGTNGRAVVYGYVESAPVEGKAVTLRKARMVLRWTQTGVFGLAAEGPREGARITQAVPSTTSTTWTQWLEVAPKAAKKIDTWKPYNV